MNIANQTSTTSLLVQSETMNYKLNKSCFQSKFPCRRREAMKSLDVRRTARGCGTAWSESGLLPSETVAFIRLNVAPEGSYDNQA